MAKIPNVDNTASSESEQSQISSKAVVTKKKRRARSQTKSTQPSMQTVPWVMTKALEMLEVRPDLTLARLGGAMIQDLTIIDVSDWYGDLEELGQAIRAKIFTSSDDNRRIRNNAIHLANTTGAAQDPDVLATLLCRMAAYCVFTEEAKSRNT